MSEHFRPRCPSPTGLVVPVAVDPTGRSGPTPGQARGPGWRRTTPRLYVPAATSPSVEQRILEQAQRLPPGGAVGGWASLRLHGAAYFDGRDAHDRELPVPLVLPPGVTLHPVTGGRPVRPTDPPPVVRRHGVPCVEPCAALLWELSRAPDHVAALVTVDMALAARVVTLSGLRAVPPGSWPRAHRSRATRAIARADPRSLSPRETWLRWVWTEVADLGAVRCNWSVHGPDDRHLATPDLLDIARGARRRLRWGGPPRRPPAPARRGTQGGPAVGVRRAPDRRRVRTRRRDRGRTQAPGGG